MLTINAVNLFLDSCRARDLSLRTIRWYEGILRHFNALFIELPAKPEECEMFLDSCKAGDERRHGYFRTLRVLYKFLEKRYGIINVISKMKALRREKKIPRPVPIDHMAQLLSFPLPGRIKAAIIFLIDTGVRVGELVKIQPEDFIMTSLGYLVKVSGKTGQRVIPVSIEAYKILLNYIPFGISSNRLSRLIARAFRQAHVPGTAHCLRHSFGTYWGGGDISLLQYIMGHTNINTTMLYRQVQYDQLIKAHSQYSPLKLVLSHISDAGII